ncbi:MAG: TetR family transcriptional regulator C-terminal domain-containing protein [Pseudomonadota bacterium]
MQQLNATAHKVLDVAEKFTQLNGFNAFSYKDLQNEVGVKTSSIHYYFPTKQDLAFVMAERYLNRFQESLAAIEQTQERGINRLVALGQIFIHVVNEGKFCLCGMLASDMLSLPANVNSKLEAFFTCIEDWVVKTVHLGVNQNEIDSSIDAKSFAQQFLASLEGGMLIARIKNTTNDFENMVKNSIEQITIK